MKELVGAQVLLPAWDTWGPMVAFHDGDYHADYARHADRVLRLTDALRRGIGLRPGDSFAVLSVNSHQFLELYHAAFLGGGTIVPLNLRLAPAEIQHILRDSAAAAIFVDDAFAGHLLRAIEPVRHELTLRKVVLIGDGDHPVDVRYEDLVASGRPVVPKEPDEGDPVVLMYTGGTTGLPKGALLDQRAELLNLYHIAMTVGVRPARVYLHEIPMFHAASMGGVLAIPSIGGVSVFQPLFDPGSMMDLVEQYQVDWTVVVPTMLAMLLEHPAFRPERFASMVDLVYGASPMPAALLGRVQQALPHVNLWQGYGMTECATLVTMLTDRDHRAGGAPLGSAGRPVLGVRLSVQGRDGDPVGRNEVGQVCVRTGSLFTGYWRKPKETAAAMRGGWYHTGDVGYLDDEGYLYLVDRDVDMIVTGGENVYPIEVENALATHPAVKEVAVIGVPHDVWGEEVHAVVVVAPGSQVTPDELAAHARATLSGYKVPKTFDIRTEPLPLSGALKPLKRELRRQYLEHRAADGGGPALEAARRPREH